MGGRKATTVASRAGLLRSVRSMEEEMRCLHSWVSGRVQGVFFRAATCQQAARLGLKGWVRNLRDGRVEVLACGEEPALEALQQWLRNGPEMARVERIEVREEVVPDGLEAFVVR